MKFKIGDVVRISSDNKIGIIVDVVKRFNTELPYLVKVRDTEYESVDFNIGWISEDKLSHVRIKNTKLARKLRPNYKEDGEWLIPKNI